MRVPTVSELLNAWEQGLCLPEDRALSMLQVAYPEMSRRSLEQLSIGRRDARLLRLREALFGPALNGVAHCPRCQTQIELEFKVGDILVEPLEGNESELRLSVEDREIVFRLPNSSDLAALTSVTLAEAGQGTNADGSRHFSEVRVSDRDEDSPDMKSVRRRLLERCVLSVTDQEQKQDCRACDLPEHIVDAVVERMAALDPQANVELDLHCPSCNERWLAPFDIVSYLWREINTWAPRVLQEVHALAASYGWSERDILDMNPVKRQLYLQMVYA